ncbi:MAG TPA: hypothetical protein VKP58_01015 [Candidatus Acidoferrum sp.]|nr:hypothetical protein [Candidatus Acidoferrum sp.]
MTHYSPEEWIDFVNGVGLQQSLQAMQKHLDAGCERCQERVAMWRRVRSSAALDAKFQPSADTVRVAKAAFGNAGFESKPGLAGIIAEVIFDSFRTPAAAGARSAGMQSRQMLFSATPFQIDVNIEAKPGESRLTVTGQLMDTSQPDSIGKGIQVTLSNRRGQTIRTVTNSFGEFHGEIENRGDLELTFLGQAEKPIVVSLRDALAYIPGPTRSGDSHKGVD